jgi:TolB protein
VKFLVTAQSALMPRSFGEAGSRAPNCTLPLLTVLYRGGRFGLKLAAGAAAGASVSLAVMNNFDARKPVPIPSAPSHIASNPGHDPVTQIPAESFSDHQAENAPLDVTPKVETPRFVETGRPEGGTMSAVARTRAKPFALTANSASLQEMRRPDGSLKLRIPLRGSLQNPAWSPDGKSIAFTRFRNGYNKGPSDVYIFNLVTGTLQEVATDGSENVSQPGSTWSQNGRIVFSSDRGGHDEIWIAHRDGSPPQKVTSRSSQMAYEPSFAPDGQSLVFESHKVGVEKMGRITLFDITHKNYTELTSKDEDCRQPNWSPRGDYILYQKHAKGEWNIWLYDVKTKQHRSVTASIPGDKTDATFSPDGRYILYSGEVPGTGGEGLLALPVEGGRPVPITRHAGYHGAPSWSPDGAYVAMEASAHAPDGTAGTELIVTPVEKRLARLVLESH